MGKNKKAKAKIEKYTCTAEKRQTPPTTCSVTRSSGR